MMHNVCQTMGVHCMASVHPFSCFRLVSSEAGDGKRSAAPNRRGNCAQWVKDAAARYTGGRRGGGGELRLNGSYIGGSGVRTKYNKRAREEKWAKNENETKHMEAHYARFICLCLRKAGNFS